MSERMPSYGMAYKAPSLQVQQQPPQPKMSGNPPTISHSEVIVFPNNRKLLRINLQNVRGFNMSGCMSVTIDPSLIMAVQGSQPIWQLGSVGADNTIEVCEAVTLWLRGDTGNPLAFNIPITEDAFWGLMRQHGLVGVQ